MAYVNIHYGPYEACGVVRHRTQRLRGLREQLEEAGHTVEFIPSPHWDRCVIEICHRNVFRCRVSNFEYNTDGKGDTVCDRAMEAVKDAIVRMRPTFFYPDIPLFSEDFFEQAVCEAFKLLNIREYIDRCIEEAVARVSVMQCLDFLIDEAMRGEYVRDLIGEAMEMALQKDYMQDLIEANLQQVFQLHDFMADSVWDALETREIIKDTIMEALTRTHPKIKEFIHGFLDTTFERVCSELDLSGGSFADIVQSTVDDQLKKGKRLGIKHILNTLVDQLSLRSRTSSKSLQSRLSSWDSKRSFESYTGEDPKFKRSLDSFTGEEYQRSRDSLDYNRSASFHSYQST